MSDYKNEIDKMTWSFSRISCFEQCKYSFYLQYLQDDSETYLPESNYYAELGSYVHLILEMIFKGELTIEEAPAYYAEHFEENVCYKVKQETMDKNYELCANYFAEVDFEWLKDYDILGVEMNVKTNIKGYDFTGYIDLLVQHKVTKDIIIIDHKSATYPLSKKGVVLKSQEHKFDSYKKQMYLYAYYIKEKYGVYPKELWWNYFKTNQFAKIPFSKDEYDKTIMWLDDVIKEIENENNYDSNEDFFFCVNLCNFRNSCEYANDKKQSGW